MQTGQLLFIIGIVAIVGTMVYVNYDDTNIVGEVYEAPGELVSPDDIFRGGYMISCNCIERRPRCPGGGEDCNDLCEEKAVGDIVTCKPASGSKCSTCSQGVGRM